MDLGQYRRDDGKFTNRQDAENARKDLNSLSINQFYIVTKITDLDDQLGEAGKSDFVAYTAKDRNATCASITGGMVGAIGGCLAGLGLLAVPGVGLILAVGTSGAVLAATIAGAGIGIASGGLISALAGSEIFED